MGVVYTKVVFFSTLIGFLLGSSLGSFCLVLAQRSLAKKSFLGRSYCPSCKKTLKWYDLFPIASYLILGGKCRYCKKKIGLEALLVELITGLLIAFLFWSEFSNFHYASDTFNLIIFFLDLFFKTFFITTLIPLFLTDIKEMLIPDRIMIPAIVIAFVYLLFETIYKVIYLYYFLSQSQVGRYLLPPHSDYFQRHALMTAQPFFGALIMALAIGGFFLSLIIITKGKGMGGGDVKLGAFMGLGLGFPNGLIAVIASFVSGALFSIVLIVLGKKRFGQAIPFGPFLILGSLLALFWGNQIFEWYLQLGT